MLSLVAIISYLLAAVLQVQKISASIGKKEVLTLATVTDVHIGENCKGDLSFDGCKPVRALTDAVNKINSMTEVDGVFVTGDITASVIKLIFIDSLDDINFVLHHRLYSRNLVKPEKFWMA